MSGENLSEGISVRGVSKSFGSIIALDDVNLEVAKGTVTALLGPNGAGKTTLIRILTTLLFPDSGMVIVSGHDAVRDATKLRSIIGLAGQNAAVDENLTGRENLELVGRLYHISKSEAKARTNRLLTKFELIEFADRRVKTYSGGMRRRLDLAASLVGNPKILFLDEPTAGLDPRSRLALWSVIKELVKEGVTMLLTTQYLEEADHLADRMVILNRGKVIAEGTSDELKSKVGGGVLELRLGEPRKLPTAVNAISSLTNGGIQSDSESGVITIPVVDGTSMLVSAIRRLDEVGIKLSGIELRKPTLDEAFLSLTGQGRGTDGLKEVD